MIGKAEKRPVSEQALFPAIPPNPVFGLERDNDAATE
jgi:hypothetical protein